MGDFFCFNGGAGGMLWRCRRNWANYFFYPVHL